MKTKIVDLTKIIEDNWLEQREDPKEGLFSIQLFGAILTTLPSKEIKKLKEKIKRG